MPGVRGRPAGGRRPRKGPRRTCTQALTSCSVQLVAAGGGCRLRTGRGPAGAGICGLVAGNLIWWNRRAVKGAGPLLGRGEAYFERLRRNAALVFELTEVINADATQGVAQQVQLAKEVVLGLREDVRDAGGTGVSDLVVVQLQVTHLPHAREENQPVEEPVGAGCVGEPVRVQVLTRTKAPLEMAARRASAPASPMRLRLKSTSWREVGREAARAAAPRSPMRLPARERARREEVLDRNCASASAPWSAKVLPLRSKL